MTKIDLLLWCNLQVRPNARSPMQKHKIGNFSTFYVCLQAIQKYIFVHSRCVFHPTRVFLPCIPLYIAYGIFSLLVQKEEKLETEIKAFSDLRLWFVRKFVLEKSGVCSLFESYQIFLSKIQFFWKGHKNSPACLDATE